MGLTFFSFQLFMSVWISAQPCYFLAKKKKNCKHNLVENSNICVALAKEHLKREQHSQMQKWAHLLKSFFSVTGKRGLAVFVHWSHARDGYVEFVFSFSKNVFLLEFWCALKLWEFFSIEQPFRIKLTAFIFEPKLKTEFGDVFSRWL